MSGDDLPSLSGETGLHDVLNLLSDVLCSLLACLADLHSLLYGQGRN